MIFGRCSGNTGVDGTVRMPDFPPGIRQPQLDATKGGFAKRRLLVPSREQTPVPAVK